MKQQINHNFTATQFDSSEQKEKFYNHFIKFVERDFPQNLFYSWFYRRLSMNFGHIAHYNSLGFFETWFTNNQLNQYCDREKLRSFFDDIFNTNIIPVSSTTFGKYNIYVKQSKISLSRFKKIF